MAAAEETKKQFIDAVRQGTHILVTVKTNPSIDQLASCIALTVLLNSLGKRATAVFSGKVPQSIDFLKPGKMLQSNTDSLQDFIISLDKAKADKLRYKVEDNMVKVYITPYQTSLSSADLVYGKGDFNVDTVIALGTRAQAELDQAITSHGRILHDARVLTMDTDDTAGGDLGSINWIDTSVSSLSEMIAQAMAELTMEKPDALDEQVATALLAGIVAETESFGNGRTTPTTMEVAGHLLAAGANQELVATRLSGPLKAPSNDSDDNRGVSAGRKHKGEPAASNNSNAADASQSDRNDRNRNNKNGKKNGPSNRDGGKGGDRAMNNDDKPVSLTGEPPVEPPILSWTDPAKADSATAPSSDAVVPAPMPAAPAPAPVVPEVAMPTASETATLADQLKQLDASEALPEVQPLRDQSSAAAEAPAYQPVATDPALSSAPPNPLGDEHVDEPAINSAIADLGIIDPLDGEGDNNGHVPPAAPPAASAPHL